MVKRVGVIGYSAGNGHPFSFSAIINGYSEKDFLTSGWPVINSYLKQREAEEFGFPGVQVTHAWTQNKDITKRLVRACNIPNPVEKLEDMIGEIDAVIIARDDWKSHHKLAKPFLELGIPVFIDKPLSLDQTELEYFSQYLDEGKLMSCSGFRYAKELDKITNLGAVKCIHGTVVLDWEKYGVHILDAALATVKSRPVAIAKNIANHQSFSISMDNGSSLVIDAIGNTVKTFHIGFFGEKRHIGIDLHDNFSAFKKTLKAFFEMCETGRPLIDPTDTVLIMKTLLAGSLATPGAGYVSIKDLQPN